MLLEKCPACQREKGIDISGKGEHYKCESCGHIWGKRPHLTRKIIGREGKVGEPSIVGGEVRRLARQIIKNKNRSKGDTPQPKENNPADSSPRKAPSSHEKAGENREKKKPRGRLGDYDIIETIGRGGMGLVYLAIQRSLGRKVAVKTLDPNLARNQASVLRFTKEAAAMAQLQHPNIVFVIDRGKDKNIYYFSMEYIDGPSLRDMLRKEGAFPVKDAVNIMLTLSRAMAYAHSQGVIHRDLKPENILFTSDGTLKIADFGLAGVNRETTHIRKLTRSYVSMGTECYMAPEQRVNAKHVDHRADIYSLGVIFYELLTGQIPYPTLPPPEKEIAPGRPDIDAIVRKCMAQHREDRYETTDELVRALENSATWDEKESDDTVVDTPAVPSSSPPSLAQRLTSVHKKIDETLSSISQKILLTNVWQRWKKYLALGGAAVLFLVLLALILPKPNWLSKIPPEERWMRVKADEGTADRGYRYLQFDFAKPLESSLFSGYPKMVWDVVGEWSVSGRFLEQNTYKREFVRNRRRLLAVYRGKSLNPQELSHLKLSASLRWRKPWSSKSISKKEYYEKISLKRPKSLAGIGLYSSKESLYWELEWKPQGYPYIALKHYKKRRLHRTFCRVRLSRKKTDQWGIWFQLSLSLRGEKFLAGLSGETICKAKFQFKGPANLALTCQNGHCQYRELALWWKD